jgi:site-specific DNA recombinase
VIAAIYGRKSTDQSGVSDEQRSVARQIEHATAYAARKGWAVADEHVYVDDGISGAEFVNRPGFLRLMNALKPRAPFQVLVMSEESRLGREAIETAYALKQLVQAGVRVFFYLEDRERTLDSPTDKIMLSLTAFADELEREKARQRTYDAMQRKAKAGHVTGGRCYGYRNVEVAGADGIRSHVRREIIPAEADVVRLIFQLCAEGYGVKAIAKRLNDDGQPSPRAQQGRSRSWAPSSVREVLHRPLYRGEIVWNQTRKRDSWGRRETTTRPSGEWLKIPSPELRIVSDEAWTAAHARLATARSQYLRMTSGQLLGKPQRYAESRYLLPGLAKCGACGCGIFHHNRPRDRRKVGFYGCTGYHLRGRTVCTNAREIPMALADATVLDHVGAQVLTPDVIEQAVTVALARLRPTLEQRQAERIVVETELAALEQEIARLANVVATSGAITGLVDALRAREDRRMVLTARLGELNAQAALLRVDWGTVRAQVTARAEEWRGMLSGHVPQARQLLRKLLVGPILLKPEPEGRRYRFEAKLTLSRFLAGILDPSSVASPGGLEPPAPRLGGECSIR